jgi:hypothetical protein
MVQESGAAKRNKHGRRIKVLRLTKLKDAPPVSRTSRQMLPDSLIFVRGNLTNATVEVPAGAEHSVASHTVLKIEALCSDRGVRQVPVRVVLHLLVPEGCFGVVNIDLLSRRSSSARMILWSSRRQRGGASRAVAETLNRLFAVAVATEMAPGIGFDTNYGGRGSIMMSKHSFSITLLMIDNGRVDASIN